jgi:hypothetical protein
LTPLTFSKKRGNTVKITIRFRRGNKSAKKQIPSKNNKQKTQNKNLKPLAIKISINAVCLPVGKQDLTFENH